MIFLIVTFSAGYDPRGQAGHYHTPGQPGHGQPDRWGRKPGEPGYSMPLGDPR